MRTKRRLQRLKKAVTLYMFVCLLLMIATVCSGFAPGEFDGSLATNECIAGKTATLGFSAQFSKACICKGISIQFRRDTETGHYPTSLSLANAKLSTLIFGLSGSWVLDKSYINQGILILTNEQGNMLNEGAYTDFDIEDIINPTISSESNGYMPTDKATMESGIGYPMVRYFDTANIAQILAISSDHLLGYTPLIHEVFNLKELDAVVTKVVPGFIGFPRKVFVQQENIPCAFCISDIRNGYFGKVGDRVHIIGGIKRYKGLRTINTATITVLAQNVPLPKPVYTNAKTIYNSINGIGLSLYAMRVRFGGKVIIPQDYSPDLQTCRYLDDGSGLKYPFTGNPSGARVVVTDYYSLPKIDQSQYYVDDFVVDALTSTIKTDPHLINLRMTDQ